MVDEKDLIRLCSWSCLDDATLDGVFKNCETCDPETRAQAQHLIRWCLQGDPSDRPNFEMILQHPFLSQSLVAFERAKEDKTEEKEDEPVKSCEENEQVNTKSSRQSQNFQFSTCVITSLCLTCKSRLRVM